jgi:hypothetical protein
MARVFETDITLNAQRELRLADADSSAYVGFKAPVDHHDQPHLDTAI